TDRAKTLATHLAAADGLGRERMIAKVARPWLAQAPRIMLAVRAFVVLLLTCTAPSSAHAQSNLAADFHSRVVALYSFEPHNLQRAEMQAKSDQLDRFWAEVRDDEPNKLPLLRAELENPA